MAKMDSIGCLPLLLIILPVLAQPIVMRSMEISAIRVKFMPEQIKQTCHHTNDSELENAVHKWVIFYGKWLYKIALML